MRHYLAPLAVLLLLCLLPATSLGADTIMLAPKLKKGDKINLLQKKTQAALIGDQIANEATSESTILVTVLSMEDGKLVVEWKVTDIKIPDSPATSHPLVQATLKMAKETVMHLQFDTKAREMSLANADDVMKQVEKMFDAVAKSMAQTSTPAQVEQYRATIKQLMQKETIEAMLLAEPSVYLGMLWREFSTKEAVKEETEITLPIGGISAQGVLHWSKATVSSDGASASLMLKQELDDEKLLKAMMTFFKDTAAKLGQRPPADNEIPKLEIDSQSQITLDLKRGIVKHIKQTKIVKAGGRGQKVVMEFEVK